MELERRQQVRYPFSCDITGGPWTRSNQEPALLLNGEIVDLSVQGAGVIGDCPPAIFAVVPWKVYLPNVPVALPVLAQVRWVEPVVAQQNAFRIGLTFLT